MDEETANQRRNKRSQRAALWREKGGLKGQHVRSRRNHNISQQRKDLGEKFYNDMLRNNDKLRKACIERSTFNATFSKWKEEQNIVHSCSSSTAISNLKELDYICQEANPYRNNTSNYWSVDVGAYVLKFYNTTLRDDPRLRRRCTNRRVLNDTINQWKIDRRFNNKSTEINISPSVFIIILIKLQLIVNTRDVSIRDEIIWRDEVENEDVTPLTTEERKEVVEIKHNFDKDQVIANRAALTFYNRMLRDDRVLRKACAYRNILDNVIHQWKKSPVNSGDPPKEGVPAASIIRGLTHKWGLIDHVNSEQRIVAWKEDVDYYNDGVIKWKDRYPLDKKGNREWIGDEEFKRRGKEMSNEYAAIVALSFYQLKMKDNPQLRNACTYRYFLNDTIDSWKMEPVEWGDPPRNASRSGIIYQLHKQWGFIKSFTSEEVIWKEDEASVDEEADQLTSYEDMLEALYDT